MEKCCRKCGQAKSLEAFPKRKASKDGRNDWCRDCYRDWHRNRYTPKSGADDAPRSCKKCGTSYRPKQRRASDFCSRTCKENARKDDLAAQRLESKPERQCLHCAASLPKSARVDAIFCSAKCNYKAHALQRKLRLRTGQDGKPGYLRAEICERDNWRCGICKGRVDPLLEHPDPMCVSLDHVVPVCEGGSNDLGNLRLVHLVCNLRRRNLGGGEQLAFF